MSLITEHDGHTFGMIQAQEEVVLSVDNLSVSIGNRRGSGKVLDQVSFKLRRGKTLGLIGESGSGKSVTAAAVLGMLPRNVLRVSAGQIMYDNCDLTKLDEEEMHALRGPVLSMVMQDPLSSLNPVMTIGEQIYEPLRRHQNLKGAALKERAIELLRLMKISLPEERLNAYPHQLSGGMRQRVVSAIALAGEPQILVADEPTTALDVTVQAAYLDLLRDIQARTGLAILFITHDFGVVADICDEVAVMYAGRIVEMGRTEQIFESPRHPYTRALLASVADVFSKAETLGSIPGSPPSIFAMPEGCRFHPRCQHYLGRGHPLACQHEVPQLTPHMQDGAAACHFLNEEDHQ